MTRKYLSLPLIVIISLICTSVIAQFGTTIYSDDFSGQLDNWEPFALDEATGTLEIVNDQLQISLTSGAYFGALYSETAFSGHFNVEVDFAEEHGVGLALVKAVNGQPSFEDYSMITIGRNNDGIIEVKLTDKQNGRKDVLDNTNLAEDSRYTQLLTGAEFSIPFNKTANKLRIFRHEREQFLHFYYAVEKEVDGEVFQDWIELAPSREWGMNIDDYFIGVIALEGTVNFDNIRVAQMPLTDQEDTQTGFKIAHRPYTWSGFTDSALVVTFGDEFLFSEQDHKFVFWELANNIPVWHLNNHTLFSYGFLETWGGGNPGCHEPMSDRLLAYSDLEIIEDNALRKVIKWSYELINPDYKFPDHNQESQLPEATEYYFIYADGSIIRKLQYAPKLDTDFRSWHEMTELIVIGGDNKRPGTLVDQPSLSFHEIGKAPLEFNNDGRMTYRNNNQRLGATSMTAHLRGGPDIFNAFSDDVSISETYTVFPLNYEVTWHWRGFNFGHWPVNREPYLANDPCKLWSSWPQQIAHTSLSGMGVDLGQDWENNYLERADGRKFRQWLSLMGMNEKDGEINSEDKTNSWLFPGTVEMINDSSVFIAYSYEDKHFEFETNTNSPACYFTTTPKTKLINPILKINNWGEHPVFINMNGTPLDSEDYITFFDAANNLSLLILGEYTDKVRFEVSSNPIPKSAEMEEEEEEEEEPEEVDKSIKIYPNPSNQQSITIQAAGNSLKEIKIYNTSGIEFSHFAFESDTYFLEMENFAKGVYIIKIERGSEKPVFRKLLLH